MRKNLLAALLTLAGLLFPAELHAQDLGNVGLRTISASLASSATCTGSPQNFITGTTANFRNLGQFSHQASAVSNAASFSMEIDGLDANGIAVRISNPVVSFFNANTTSYVAQGSGYYTNIQVSVTCTAAATFSLSYTASFGTGGVITGAPAASVFINNGNGTNVQGVIPQQTSGTNVDPLINGGLQPPLNLNFAATGLDIFNASSVTIGSGFAGNATIGLAPSPTKTNETAIALERSVSLAGGTSLLLAPWACAPGLGGSCTGSNTAMSVSSLGNVTAYQPYQRSWQNAFGGTDYVAILEYTSPSTAIRQASTSQTGAVNSFGLAFSSNTLAGSTLLLAVSCATPNPCSIATVTDTQGLTWKQVTNVANSGASNATGLSVWQATTVSLAAADTVTATAIAGTNLDLIVVVELTGTTPTGLTYPSISNTVDTVGAQLIRTDAVAGNQFNCSLTLTTNTTTLCQPAPTTINGIPVRLYVTDFQINTTTAGTASNIQLKTGTGSNCGTGTANLSAITYSTSPAAVPTLTSVLGTRTPLIAPLQSQVCATQAGTAAGTAVVEIRGFLAP